jgi:hypothetical protein
MAIPFYLSNVLDKNVNTFGEWFERTNALSSDMGAKVLTAETTTSGGTTTGNTSLVGIFSASVVAVGTSLRGGTVTTPAALSIISATSFTANTNFSGLETISNHANHSITANTFVLSTDTITATSQTFSLTSDDVTIGATNIILNGNITSTDGILNLTANTTFSGSVLLNSSDFLKIPTGTVAERPLAPVNGMIRFNEDAQVFEGYAGTVWANLDGNTLTSTTLATITETPITTFSATTYGGGKFIITAKVGVNRHIVELLVTHDGTTAIATQYGDIQTSGSLATYNVDISTGNVRILVTGASASSTIYKVQQTLVLA